MSKTKPSNNKEQDKITNFSELTPEQFKKLAGMNGRPQPVQSKNGFPVDVFPQLIQDIIKALDVSLKYPIDFTGASILGAASIAIGNTFRVELKKGFIQNAVLYMAIVGKPGTNKTHPLTFAMKPLRKRDSAKYKDYKLAFDEFIRISKMPVNDRKKEGIEIPEKPVWEQLLISDFTPEALADVHNTNQRGIGVYCDELASWFKNFNRYNNSSAEQFYLSQWSGTPITINRKTTEPTHLPKPFVTVLGTIQPGVINELAKDRTQNGFIDRILFVIFYEVLKSYWSETELDQSIINQWHTIIETLLDLPLHYDNNGQVDPTILKYTSEAKTHLFAWQRTMTDISNASDNDTLKGIYSKMEQYCIRFSLILEMLRKACAESAGNAIGIESVIGAIKLTEYFTVNALKVHEILNASPVERLTSDKQKVYEALPDEFSTKEGVKIAFELGMPERTFKQFIANQELFIKPKHGKTQKRF